MLSLGLSLKNVLLNSTSIAATQAAIYSVLAFDPNLVFDFENEYYRTSNSKTTFESAISHNSTTASNGTMVDSDGLLKWRPHNLATYSEDISQSAWTKSANVTISGTDKIVPNLGATSSLFIYKNLNTITELYGQTFANTNYLVNLNDGSYSSILGTFDSFSVTPDGSGFVVEASLDDVTFRVKLTKGEWEYSNVQFFNTNCYVYATEAPGGSTGDGDSGIYATELSIYRSDLGGMVNNPDRGDSYVRTAGRAIGAELFSEFSSVNDPWVYDGNGSYTIDGSQVSNKDLSISPFFSTVKTYLIEYTLSGVTGSLSVFVGEGSAAAPNTNGTHTLQIEPTQIYFIFRAAAGATATVSNVSVREADVKASAARYLPRRGHHVWNGSAYVNEGLLIESEQRTNYIPDSQTVETKTVYVTPQEYTLSFNAGTDISSQLSQTIAVTAVDVFVYDTRKDSDGGAWRTGALAQASSWYNETLNTATRGSRREFPEVAVIVAEAAKVTIYDGDDPTLPMWMVFNHLGWQNNNAVALWNPPRSLAILNGHLCVGHGDGVARYGFVDDYVENRRTGFNAVFSNGIVGRNTRSFYSSVTTSNLQLVNDETNDVAMTVLPGAPTDPTTGLPVPTIAVATNGGVSVIKDDGTVTDSLWNVDIGLVGFTSDNDLWYFRSSGSTHRAFFATLEDYSAGDGFGDQLADERAGFEEFDLLTRSQKSSVFLDSFALGGFSSAVANTVPGLMLHQPNYTDQTKGISALLTSTYNTGWMNGDIKGAFLSDTDDTDLVGSGELVTNGTFDTDTTGWTAARSATLTWVSGAMQITYGGTDYPQAQQTLTTVAGKRYKLQVTQTAGVSLAAVMGTVAGGNQLGSVSGTGSLTLDFVASSTTSYLTLQANSVGSVSVTVDNVSVKLADEDRSVNNNGLIVNGTVTRTAVATGADLVAYSGFSASNYLEQTYNPDLDFGTGDFCVMGWVKTSAGVVAQTIVDRRSNTGSDGFVLNVLSTKKLFFRTRDASLNSDVTSTSDVPLGSYFHFAAKRSSSGTLLELYINGVLDNSATVTARDVDVAAPLFVGVDYSAGSIFIGSLALIRISATAPTADQIAKIYEDEKHLFQENAQATLYGASDAVTALAHDPDTDLLHVGTSAGRSIFKGLRRIDNTTDAVGTAISASGGFIVEE